MITPTVSNTRVTDSETHEFEVHWARGRFNAMFFGVMGPYLNWNLRTQKRRVFDQLPRRVVEIGPGVGANLRFFAADATLVAIEPNPHMHRRLKAAPRRKGIHLELHDNVGERIDLADHSVDTVISSLVLCSVNDPAHVLAEICRNSAPRRPLQLRRARRRACSHRHPSASTGAPPPMGLDIRRVLVRTRPRNHDPRRRIQRCRHRTLSTPHAVHPL
jgi:SAM-dependent methyltransferase